jgi:flagellar biosynthesis/type III secretory pathway protein FliH
MDGYENKGYSARLIRAGTPAPPRMEGADVTVAPEGLMVDPHQAEADRIIARAEALAESMITRAQEAAQRLQDQAEIDAKIKREARLAEELLSFSRKIRMELDEVRPLLTRMVIEAVEAIVGTMPEEALAERMIRRALRDFEGANQAILITARADYEALSSVVHTMRMAGETTIRSVQTDPDLPPGTCRLESGGISLALGLRAQLDVLEAMLLREEAAERTAPYGPAQPASVDQAPDQDFALAGEHYD